MQLNETAKQWLHYNNPADGSNSSKNSSLETYQNAMGRACLQDAKQVLANKREVREHQVECRKLDGNIRIIA